MWTTRLILIGAASLVLLLGDPARTPRALADAELVSSEATIEASSFDGQGDSADSDSAKDTDFEEFSDTVSVFDDPSQGRSAAAEATQDTTVDDSDPLELKVDTSGAATASWTDGETGDGADPAANATSEFSLTVEITEHPSAFQLVGSIEAGASPVNAGCTLVSVTAPGGNTFEVGAPSGCGDGQASIDDSGELEVGTHTFSVIANAAASNPNALAGNADASFNLSLRIGCSVELLDGGTGDEDTDEDNIPDEVEVSIGTSPFCKDTDGDGLLDPWEASPSTQGAGFDLDEDGNAEATRDEVFGPYNGQCPEDFGPRREQDGQNCSLVSEPDPLHKDIYVEIDWQDCLLGSCPELVGLTLDPSHHAPNMQGLLDAVNVFRTAPVSNPDDGIGINLHILVDEAIAHDHNCDQGAAETRPANFGTAAQRGDPEVMAAREMAFRYAWSGHSSLKPTPQECPLPSFADVLLAGAGLAPLPEYDISPHGFATPGGRDILVTLAVTWICQLYSFDSGPLVTYAPCFRSLAPVTGLAPGLFPAEIALANGGTMDVQWPQHMMFGVAPSQGVRQLWGRAFMNLLGQSLGLSNFDASNDPNSISPHTAESYRSWEGLAYAPPHAGGGAARQSDEHHHHHGGHVHATSNGADFVPIFPDFSLADQDADGDGTAEGADNCPALANPSQADLDSDGFGDACDADKDGDGLAGDDDASPGDTNNDGTDNVADDDDDGDGVPDGGDNCPLATNAVQADLDGDGLGDSCDPDTDGDGLPNGLETTMGSDPAGGASLPEFLGLENTCGDGLDNDGDGDADGVDRSCQDADGDSVPDSLDNCPDVATINLLDTDDDGAGDLCDASHTKGDVDCDGDVDAVDAQKTLQHVAGLPVAQGPGCPAIGVGDAPFGDVDCDDDVDAVDALSVLRHVAGLPVNLPPGCPEIAARSRSALRA